MDSSFDSALSILGPDGDSAPDFLGTDQENDLLDFPWVDDWGAILRDDASYPNPDRRRGVEHAVTATDEHCFNSQADSGVSGTHCRNTRSGGAEAVNSSQQVSSHSFNQWKDKLDRFRKEVHSLTNHGSKQGASCSTLPDSIVWRQGASCSTFPDSIRDEDEIQSTSCANINGQELQSDLGAPGVGMAFCSEKAVYDFYSNYAKKAGFNVRRGKAEYLGSDKSVIKAKYFLCSCQGHKSKWRIEKPTRYKRQDTRTGCEAMIKCMVNDEIWKISKVILEHNHSLKGCFADVQGSKDSHATTSLSTGKIADEITTAKEWTFVSNVNPSDVSQGTRKSSPMPASDDTQDLICYLKKMQIEDPFFFYTPQVEASQGMTNLFWRDSRSKVDYMHFGDVLVMDTRTRINQSDMICAAFWGLNHHRQRIIFGCAVLVNQNVRSFEWLLQSFLEAMSWHEPRTIITDVSEEIANALTVVLPRPRHCLASWSILNSFSKNLSTSIDRDLFSECLFNVHSQEEFESKWNSFIGKFKVHDDPWIASLYRTREKWSHAFTKNLFCGGLLSIKNDENASPVFRNLSCETLTLSQIAIWCGKVAEHLRAEELKEDRHCEKDMENLKSRSPVEKEAERLYTQSIFRMFQGELINSLSLAIEESGATSTHCKFKLTEEGSMKIDTVEFDHSNLTLACSCGKFDSVGILCFHALKVLNSKNIFKIPSRYLLKRWTKSAKDSLPVNALNAVIACQRDPVNSNSFYAEFMQKTLHVAHICATKKRKRLALRYISLALETIAKAPRTEEIVAAVGDSDDNDDMGQTSLDTQLDQDNEAKSGMGCPRVQI